MNSNYIFVVLAHFFCVFIALRTFFCVVPSFLVNFINCGIVLTSTILVGWLTVQFTKSKWLSQRVPPDGKAVLIIGCNKEFGHDLAFRLDSLGYLVFATFLTLSEPKIQKMREKCSSRLQVLEMDVTKDQSVQAAVEFVKSNLDGSELWAVVNNVGLFKGLSVELAPLQDFKDAIEVNTYGPLRIAKAFLPLLRQSKGRIVNLSSLAGRIPLPHFTPYIMSKYAAVGLNDCLRQEMDAWGVSVISVEPELYKTSMTDPKFFFNPIEKNLSSLNESIKGDYGDEYFKLIRKLTRILLDFASPKTETVVDDLESAVTLEHPDLVYHSSRNAFYRFLLPLYKITPSVAQDAIVKISSFVLLLRKLKPRAR